MNMEQPPSIGLKNVHEEAAERLEKPFFELGNELAGTYEELKDTQADRIPAALKRKNIMKAGLIALSMTIASCGANHGENNFSDKNVEDQKTWVKEWISGREKVDGYTQAQFDELKTVMLKNIREIAEIIHKPLEKGRGGKYENTARGSVGAVYLNENENAKEQYARVPLHEIYHAANKAGVHISKEQRALIENSIKSEDSYKTFLKEDDATKKLIENGASYSMKRTSPGEYYSYVKDATEFASYLMELRHEMGFTPKEHIDDATVEKIYDMYKEGKLKSLGSQNIIQLVKDKESLKHVLNGIVMETSEREPGNDIA